jgi:hypothetical protein
MKIMKKLSIVLGILCGSFMMNAQGDTTKISIGDREIQIISKGDSLSNEIEQEVESAMQELEKELEGLEKELKEDVKKEEIDYNDFAFISGIEMKSNMLINSSNTFKTIDGYEFLETDPGKSISISLMLLEKYIPISKQHIGLVTGLGFDFTSFSFTNDMRLSRSGESVVASIDSTKSYSKNKLKVGYVKVPLLLQFLTGKSPEKSFHIAIGGYGVIRMGKGKLKLEYSQDGNNHNDTSKKDFNLNSLNYGLEARVGYGKKALFATYALSSLFNNEANVELYPVSAGIALAF